MPEVTVGLIIGLFAGGLIAVVLEIFIPGGVVGTLGGLAIIASIIMGFSKNQTLGGVLLAAGVVLVPVCLIAAMNAAPKLPFSRKLFLQESLDADKGYVSTERGLDSLLGRKGVVVADLRPSGMVDIEGRRTDVVTNGEMIDKGIRVKVVEVEGNRVVVEAENA